MTVFAHIRDAVANDSDKVILTAPASKLYKIEQVHVQYTSTATVGNRQLVIAIRDGDNTLVADYHAGAVQAASNTYHYTWAQGVYRETSFVDNSIHCPFPINTLLLSGWDIRVYDSAAVAAAADDMTVDIIYKEVSNKDQHRV